jgi:membrane protein implicated in regulation of membrane protease activity
VVSLILGVMSAIGLEHHDVVDLPDAIGWDAGGGGIFSVKPLTGFLLGFGWAGGIALGSGLGILAATAIAVGAGLSVMGLVVALLRLILGMRSDGTARISDTLHESGTVYVTVPPDRQAGGQVTVHFRGRQETYMALNRSNRPIPSGERVRVVEVLDSQTVLVEPL